MGRVNVEARRKYQRDRYATMRDKESIRSRLKSEKRKAKGLCHNCSKPQAFGSVSCEEHWFAQRATQRLGLGPKVIERGRSLKAILVSQDFKCAYTGRPLACGENASVEHKVPQSRRPDLKAELSNIEWLDLRVNRMKTDMTREEFIDECVLIAERAGRVKRIE